MLTTVASEPPRLQVERWADVENVRVLALAEVGDTQLGTGGGGRTRVLCEEM